MSFRNVRANVDVRPQTRRGGGVFEPALELVSVCFGPASAEQDQGAGGSGARGGDDRSQTGGVRGPDARAYMDVYENITLVQNPTKGRTEHVTHGEHRAELWVPGDNNMKFR